MAINNFLRIIIRYIGLCILSMAIFISLVLILYSHKLCREEIVRNAFDIQNGYYIDIVTSDCGATTNFITEVKLYKKHGYLLWDSGRLVLRFEGRSEDIIQITWGGEDLVVFIKEHRPIYESQDTFGKIKILFKNIGN